MIEDGLPEIVRHVETAFLSHTVASLLVRLRRDAQLGVPETLGEALGLQRRGGYDAKAYGRTRPFPDFTPRMKSARSLLRRVAKALVERPSGGTLRSVVDDEKKAPRAEARKVLLSVAVAYKKKYDTKKKAYTALARQLGLGSAEAARAMLAKARTDC